RYTVQAMAREAGIGGWVRNRPDGSVEMLAEGESGALHELVERISAYFGQNIQKQHMTETESFGQYPMFEIMC
ncbi:MAG: acylphosphatase, partial [Candidatus Omnitrophica bacterium]|nr:acylphosphatase [Candidatus Omnitrophota bacterium]